jgi:hypothetical protein
MLDHRVSGLAKNNSMKFRQEILFETSLTKSANNGGIYKDTNEPYQMIYMSGARDPDTAQGGAASAFTTELFAVFKQYEDRKAQWHEMRYKSYFEEVAAAILNQQIVYAEVGNCVEILKDHPYKIKRNEN